MAQVSMDLITGGECSYLKPKSWRLTEFETWCSRIAQGMGIHLFGGDKVSNDWLRTGRRGQWKESHFIRALQMRSNVLPTLELKCRGQGVPVPPCRACGKAPESAAHILSWCEATRLNRMNRHNRLCLILADAGRKLGWTVFHEKHIYTRGGRLGVPDLIFVRGDTLLVIDVTVRFDGGVDGLYRGTIEKEVKYGPFLGMLRLEFPLVVNSSANGFVMGVRGKWLESNFRLLQEIGLNKTGRLRIARVCSRITILKSVDVFQAFNKLVRGKALGIVTYTGE